VARINVEQKALTDPRFRLLGTLLGYPPHIAAEAALGQMVKVWNECQERGCYQLPLEIVQALLGDEKAPKAIYRAELGDENGDFLRIKGTEGRVEWLENCRKKGREGGRLGGRPRNEPPKPLGVTKGVERGKPLLPPAPAPIPDCSPNGELVSAKRRHAPSNGYQPGFLAAWNAYPHHSTRSKKAQSAEIWRKLGLEAHSAAILSWIEAASASQDWQKQAGAFVPGFQVWIKGRDFDEKPPEPPLSEGEKALAMFRKEPQ